MSDTGSSLYNSPGLAPNDFTIAGNLTVSGTTTTISTTNTVVKDKLITLNDGGAAQSGTATGIEIEENASATGYIKTDGTGDWTFRGAGTAATNVLTLDINATKTFTVAGALGIEADSVINQDLSSDSTAAAFATLTISTSLLPDATGGADLGSTAAEWGDLFMGDGKAIKFGASQEITLTHVADSGLSLKHAATDDDKYPIFTLQAGDDNIALNDKLGVINFQAPDEGAGTDAILVAAGIEAVSEGDFAADNNATALLFKTGASEAAAEKVRITSAGKVGIGTSSPEKTFHIHGANSTDLEIRLTERNAGDTDNLGFNIGYLGGVGSASTNRFSIESDNAGTLNERLVITRDTGRVGIGTTDPGTTMQLEAAAPYLTLKNSTSENGAGGCESKLIFEDHGNNALGQIEVSHVGTSDDEKGRLTLSTNNDSGLQAALTINEAQKVGIGNTAPAQALHIGDAADTVLQVIRLQNDNATCEIGVVGGGSDIISTSAAGDLVIANRSAKDILFGTDNTQRMIIDSAGNVGIGANIDPPTSALQVVGDTIELKNTDVNSNPGIQIVNDTKTWKLQVRGAQADSFFIRDNNAGANRLGITSGGLVGIGIDIPLCTLHVAGAFAASGPSAAAVVFADVDDTPSVATGNFFESGAATETITFFDGGVIGQVITVVSKAAITYTPSNEFRCGTAPVVTASGDLTRWTRISATQWQMISFIDMDADQSGGI